jgi:BirA family biotin operon repressor/biotin-[acetyl-CoA-carboxylase] ligase
LAILDHVDSTNSEALRHAGKGEPQGLWVWALSQGEGRGRLGRRWESLEGNLFASLLLRPECPAMTATQLGFVAGIALHDAVMGFVSEDHEQTITLKWPNDLLCDAKKAGGILLESTSDASGERAVVIGIGLNLSTHPQGTDYPATNLALNGHSATPAKALEHLAIAFDHWYGVWNEGAGFESIRTAWMERSLALGSSLEIRLEVGRLQGTYRGIDTDGALILTLADGSERRINTGDIFPL